MPHVQWKAIVVVRNQTTDDESKLLHKIIVHLVATKTHSFQTEFTLDLFEHIFFAVQSKPLRKTPLTPASACVWAQPSLCPSPQARAAPRQPAADPSSAWPPPGEERCLFLCFGGNVWVVWFCLLAIKIHTAYMIVFVCIKAYVSFFIVSLFYDVFLGWLC